MDSPTKVFSHAHWERHLRYSFPGQSVPQSAGSYHLLAWHDLTWNHPILCDRVELSRSHFHGGCLDALAGWRQRDPFANLDRARVRAGPPLKEEATKDTFEAYWWALKALNSNHRADLLPSKLS